MLSRLGPLLALILGVGAVTAQAQTLQKAGGPAEFPPSSFTGKQYVDSKGCVYIRAGVGGETTWIPRVARNRQVVCGFQPTFANRPAPEIQKPLDRNVVQIQPAEVPRQTAPRTEPEPRTASAPTPRAAPAPVVKAAPAPKAVARPAPKPAPQRQVVRQVAKPAAPAPRVVRQTPQPRVIQPAPVIAAPAPQVQPRVARTGPSPAPKPTVYSNRTAAREAPAATATVPVRSGGVACPNLSAIGQQYVNPKGSYPVRCGPQAEPPSVRPVRRSSDNAIVGYAVGNEIFRFSSQPGGTVRLQYGGQLVSRGQIGPHTRIMPRHVYEARQNALVGHQVPKGYRRAFDDDRLNPRRAEMTFAGIAQMELVWTNTVPRRLVDRATGQDVASMIGQMLPTVSSSGQPAPERRAFREAPRTASAATSRQVVRKAAPQAQVQTQAARQPAASPSNPRAGRSPAQLRAAKQTKAAVVSTRSTPAPAPKPVAGAHRYVQVGTFGVPSNAQNTANRLRGAGLPVRTSGYTRGGKSYQIVLAGPFADAAALSRALGVARSAGFRDAFTRN